MLVQQFGDLPLLKDIPELISLDTETDSLEDRNIEGYSFAYYTNGELLSYYVPVQHEFNEVEAELYRNIDYTDAMSYLRALVKPRRVIYHNAQFDLDVLEGYDIFTDDDKFEDSMLLHFSMDTERDHGLKKIMKAEYGVEIITYEQAKKLGFEDFALYGDNDARYTYIVFNDVFYQMKNGGRMHTFNLYKNYELPFVRVLQAMNRTKNSIRIDRDKLIHCNEIMEKELEIVSSVLRDKVGDINFNSTLQLGDALIEKGYNVKRNPPTAKMVAKAIAKGEEPIGNYSLDEKALKVLAKRQSGRIINAILYNRKMRKLYTTYVKPLLERLECVDEKKNVWVLKNYYFNHIGARTGRLSALNPNMQNQQRDPVLMRCGMLTDLIDAGIYRGDSYINEQEFEKIYKKDGKKYIIGEKYEADESLILAASEMNIVDIRALYIAMPGRVFIGADYSQLELRMMAHFSQDPVMLHAYNNDIDIHAQTRDRINEIVGATVLDRQSAKTTNFFLQYGGWIKSLASMLGCTMAVAKQIFNTFNLIYKVRAKWVEETHEISRQSHFAQTILGRRRNVHSLGINDKGNYKRANNAQNGSISHVISGSSADLIKIAMINLHKNYFDDLDLKLQVHDELLIEVDEDKAEYYLDIVKTVMENAMNLSVKIVADASIGSSWRECH